MVRQSRARILLPTPLWLAEAQDSESLKIYSVAFCCSIVEVKNCSISVSIFFWSRPKSSGESAMSLKSNRASASLVFGFTDRESDLRFLLRPKWTKLSLSFFTLHSTLDDFSRGGSPLSQSISLCIAHSQIVHKLKTKIPNVVLSLATIREAERMPRELNSYFHLLPTVCSWDSFHCIVVRGRDTDSIGLPMPPMVIIA